MGSHPLWPIVCVFVIAACHPATAPSANATTAPSAAATEAAPLASPIAIDLPDAEDFDIAADDRAVAFASRSGDGQTALQLAELGSGKWRTIETASGRGIRLRSGAIRGDLVTFVEMRRGDAGSVTWRVLVANWRSGAAPIQLDEFAGMITSENDVENYPPDPATNGHDVVWMRAPRPGGNLGDVQIVRWNVATTTVVHRGPATYSIDDKGRMAFGRAPSAPTASWELMLIDEKGSHRLARRPEGGAPYLAGAKVAWARTTGAVTTLDVIDVASGAMRTLTQDGCLSVGATVRHAVFFCGQKRARVVGVEDFKVTEIIGAYWRADPHAIIGRSPVDGRWTVTPVTG